MDETELRALADSFSTVFSRHGKELGFGLDQFPLGCCTHASEMMFFYLTTVVGSHEVKYKEGKRGDGNTLSGARHDWLEVEGRVLDITCGQYDDAPSRLIVSTQSRWHEQFDSWYREAPRLETKIDEYREAYYQVVDKVNGLLN
jgi:hypothetical protein